MPLLIAAMRTRAELYIAHYPAALPAAAAAARRYGALYAYDAEDFHLGDWPDDPAYAMERRLVRGIEARYLPGCAYVTAAAPGIADAYCEAFDIDRPRVILNVFPLSQSPPAPTPRGTAEQGPSVYWFSQTIGPGRGLECAVRAVGLARTRPHLHLRGTPAADYGEYLKKIAVDAGAASLIHILPPDDPEKMECLAAAYDIGLVAETGHSKSRQLCLTNKLFSYLLAGVPPLMSDTAAHRKFAEETFMTDFIYPIDDVDALAGLLDQVLGDPNRLATARADAWRLGQNRYNWERESGGLVEAVNRAISAPGRIL
ncbi:glycosyltransferase family 4 protein [Hyphomicrobium facile]|nr:glycosyltransferase family 4 protein [Hyphomicrobium facile]